MTREQKCEKIIDAIDSFEFLGKLVKYELYGSGHVNDTFCVQFTNKRYIMQRLNDEAFKNPDELMENVVGVTRFLAQNSSGKTLTVILTKTGESLYKDGIASYWRAYEFIEGARTYDKVQNSTQFFESGVAFGNFQRVLSSYKAETLHETIKGFHNTPERLRQLKDAIQKDAVNRVCSAKEEIDFFLSREKDCSLLTDQLKNGELPLKVTHNDTKLNNVMIDDVTGKGICVIDLDTVMPGLAAYDFGDSIRFGCNPASEDETDISKVIFDFELYKTFLGGFLQGCAAALTKNELQSLPLGAKLMTLECGMRFLTDYLVGDVYFKTSRALQNLDRARTQIKLVQDMEERWSEMQGAVVEIAKI